MDTNNLISAVATGFGIGISTMLFSTIIFIPISYVMNKYIYHTPAMRIILAIFAGAFSVLSLIIIIVKRLGGMEKVHYFGLLPVWMKTEDIEPTGWSAFLFKIFAVFTHPFMMFFLDGDVNPFKNSLDPLLVPKDTPSLELKILDYKADVKVYNGAVNEVFSQAARIAGSIKDDDKWRKVMTDLQRAGKFIFDADMLSGSIMIDSAPNTSAVASNTSNVGAPESSSS